MVAALARPAAAEIEPGDLPRGQLKFRVFSGADGLLNLVVSRIAQDAHGFLWIGTDEGVYRFDGERFAHVPIEDGLTSSWIVAIGIAPDGEPCVGGKGGLACWDGTRFARAHTQGLPPVMIRTIDSFGGKLWVGTQGAGLYVRDPGGAFAPAPGWPRASTIWSLWADANGLVVGDDTGARTSSGDGVWHDIAGIGDERVDGVLRERQGTLWIRTPSHMWLLRPGETAPTDVRDGLPTGYDSAGHVGMAIGPAGVLVGTDFGIAYRAGDHWHVIDRAAGIPAASVRTLFVDREGTTWIGAKGLLQQRGRGVIESFDEASGLPGDVAWSFQRDRHGALWVGTNRCLAHVVAARWTCLPGTEGRIVRTFAFAPQGGVFVGGAPADLLYVDPDGHATSLGDFGQLADHNILALAFGPTGDLWIATKRGLYRLPGAVPGPLEHVVVPGTRPDASFASLAIVGDRLWTATEDGLLVLDGGVWHRFDTAAGFRSAGMRYVLARADGRMCTAYVDAIGVTCFRYDGHTVSDLQHIGIAEGMTSGMVYSLGEDRQQRLWIGTGAGVDVVTAHGMDHLDEQDGIAGNDSTAMAFLLDRDGSLWMGSTGGATHVFAQAYRGPPDAPRTLVLDGRLGDLSIRESIAASGAGLEVGHDHNALTVELASSSLVNAARVEYEVRLSPLETAWTATHQREVRYPALLPGSYHFEARARIGTGPWGAPTVLQFVVLAAWWQSAWFVTAMALIFVVAIGTAFAWRQRAVLRRRTRQLNEQAEASFRVVIDQMPDLISVYRDRKLVYLNVAQRRFFGLDDSEASWGGIAFLDRVHPDDRAQVLELFRRVPALDARAPDSIEVRTQAADGSWRTCEVSGVRVDIGGAATLVASGRDVTERNRLRAKILVSDRMASLGTLVAGIAHEINNPLTYVMGNLEVIAETLAEAGTAPTDEDRACLDEAIGDARDGADRVRKIVLGLRTFSRSEDEKRVPLQLPAVLEAAIKLTSNEVRHRAQLVRELGATPIVVADDGRLTQVFINLLINAAHAIPAGHSDQHRITVRTRTDDQGRAVIEIEDTGAGIEPDVQVRVFDPFFTTKEVGVGTGLGLSICHGIVSGLDGQISIERAPVRGTVARVVLPPWVAVSASPVAAEGAKAGAAPDAARRHRIMVVDDEPLVAHAMERLLSRDYDVTVALCGEAAIEHIVAGTRFAAIVSDVMMPNMTGLELLEEIDRVAPEQARRVIFLTGGVFTQQARDRLDQLDLPQLQKPIGAAELRACIGRMIDRPN